MENKKENTKKSLDKFIFRWNFPKKRTSILSRFYNVYRTGFWNNFWISQSDDGLQRQVSNQFHFISLLLSQKWKNFDMPTYTLTSLDEQYFGGTLVMIGISASFLKFSSCLLSADCQTALLGVYQEGIRRKQVIPLNPLTP